MSLETTGVWETGVWAFTPWADGVWREGAYVPEERKAQGMLAAQHIRRVMRRSRRRGRR